MSSDSHLPRGLSPLLGRTIDERTNFCFGCGPDNPEGLHLHFAMEADSTGSILAVATVHLSRNHEGASGYIHGGILATLMDEAMSKLSRPLEVLAVTRHLEVEYLQPAPTHIPLTLTARHLRREGRKLFHEAELTATDGTVLTRAKGLFVVIDPAKLRAHAART